MAETFLAHIGFFAFRRSQDSLWQLFKIRAPMIRGFEFFEEDQSRDTVAVSGYILDRIALVNLARHAIQRFISTIFRKIRTTPIKEFDKRLANRFIFLARLFQIWIKASQKLIEGFSS